MDRTTELLKLGNQIRKFRIAKGLSQAALATAVLKDQQSIHKAETGEFNPTYLYLLEISEGLGVTISELLDFK